MSEKKIFCGSGTSKSDGWQKISICLSDLPKEYMTTAKNGKVYINLNVNKKQQPDQYGKDLSVSVDTWKPQQQSQPASAPAKEPIPVKTLTEEIKEDEIPI